MSRNSKNAQRILRAREAKGTTGPEKTKPLHGKKNAWWQKFPSYSAYINGGKAPREANA